MSRTGACGLVDLSVYKGKNGRFRYVVMPLASRAGVCEIQCLHGERLVAICRDATCVSFRTGASGRLARRRTASPKLKVGNKAIPSCRLSLPWRLRPPSAICMRISALMSKPWLSSTTHTFCLHLTARSSSTSASRGMRSIEPTSASTLRRPAFRTAPGSTLRVFTRSRRIATCGSAAGPWIQPIVVLWHLEYPWARRNLLLHSFRPCSPSRGFSLTACCSSPTLRLRGCCSLSALPLVHNTRFAPCHLQIHGRTPLGMMLLSSAVWMPCCMPMMLPGCQFWPPHGPNLRCAMADLNFAALSAMPSRLTGHLGPMLSPPSRAETQPSLKPSRALWKALGCCAFGGAPCSA